MITLNRFEIRSKLIKRLKQRNAHWKSNIEIYYPQK